MGKLCSMTGFASGRGELGAHRWAWDLRSVNAKGLDLRLRLPDWIEGLEPELRKALTGALGRGSLSLSLRVHREATETTGGLNADVLRANLAHLGQIEGEARAAGLTLAPTSAADLLTMPGMIQHDSPDDDTSALRAALIADLAPVVAALVEMRRTEGAALFEVLTGQLETVEDLVGRAAALMTTRQDHMAEFLKASLAKVMQTADGMDPDRVAQELALIAVKQDITEEIDRLRSHVTAARDLLAKGGPVGRKLDFLMQEFNREANTLCSKSQFSALTSIGLDLKAVIDQMREQVQNVE